VLRIRIRMDSHHFEKQYTDPHEKKSGSGSASKWKVRSGSASKWMVGWQSKRVLMRSTDLFYCVFYFPWLVRYLPTVPVPVSCLWRFSFLELNTDFFLLCMILPCVGTGTIPIPLFCLYDTPLGRYCTSTGTSFLSVKILFFILVTKKWNLRKDEIAVEGEAVEMLQEEWVPGWRWRATRQRRRSPSQSPSQRRCAGRLLFLLIWIADPRIRNWLALRSFQ